jgi:hypothetical protein
MTAEEQKYLADGDKTVAVSYETDVLVVGGSVEAVAAAEASAKTGAKTMLITSNNYLGEDLTATLRLWQPQQKPADPLAAAIYKDDKAVPVNSSIKKDADAVSPPRPMHVKKVLDDVLLKSKVEFLYGAFITGDVKNQDGKDSGVLISNRAGRQAVAAKKVIDLRNAGLKQILQKIYDKHSATATVEFIVVGGEPVKIPANPLFKSVRCEEVNQHYLGQKSSSEQKNIIPYKILRYLFDIDRDYALTAFCGDISKYENIVTEIRIATYSPQLQFSADQISLLAPDEKQYEFNESTLDKSRSVGKVAAETAKKLPPLEIRSLRAESGNVKPAYNAKIEAGQTAELLGGVRPYEKQLGSVQFPGANYEIDGEYDVIVVGGGTTGAPAGIGAARTGAKTLVVELQSELGGVGTLGSITGYYHGNITGFTKEVNEALYPGKNSRGWSATLKSKWWLEEIKKHGGEVWLGVLGAGAITSANNEAQTENGRTRVSGVLLATPFGVKAVLAKTVIDTTGAGDVALAAGSEMRLTTNNEITVQGAGLSPRGLGFYKMNNDYTFVDDTDPVDTTHLYVYSKEKYPNAFDQGKVIGTRERRQIVGDYTITALDQLTGRTYDDSIARSYSDFDLHGYSTSPFLEIYHPKKREAYYTYYPYRASLPKNLDGILVGALATSSQRDAIPMTRMQADLQNQGYALGYIAAVAAKQTTKEATKEAGALAPASPAVNLRNVNIREIQKHLVEIGILPKEALTETDNYEALKAGLPKAVEELPQNSKDALLVMQYPAESLPLVKAAYKKAADFDTKIVYARALALLGDKTGEETLLESVKNQAEWDEGWNYKSMSNFGSPSSQLDKDIMMLGRLKSKAALPFIVEKLNKLQAKDAFSHHRACYLALEEIGDRIAAKDLAAHLKKPDMQGYWTANFAEAVKADKSDPNVNLAEESRRNSLREIGAARALYRLGDYEELGRSILEHYSKDLRGHFARNAAEILENK